MPLMSCPMIALTVDVAIARLLRRIATLMPRAGQNLIRSAGVLAANSRVRPRIVPVPEVKQNNALTAELSRPPARTTPLDWASLVRRVYDIDALRRPCGGRIKIIALIDDAVVARKILDHVGIDSAAPLPAPARDPPGQMILW